MGSPSAPLAVAPEPVGRADAAPALASPVWRALSVGFLAVAIAVLAFTRQSFGAGAFILAFLAAVLVLVAAADLERMVIPARIVLPAIARVLLAGAAWMPAHVLGYLLAAAVAATRNIAAA